MKKITNQEIEWRYFEMFRKVYPLPQGTPKPGDKPDVIIEGKERIGIEITNFFIEEGSLLESEQTQIKFRERVVSSAQKIYQNDNGRNIQITFGFDKDSPIRDKKLELKLVDLAKHIENLETGMISRETFRTIPELNFVYLQREGYQGQKWRVQQVYRGSTMSRDRLVKIIREKEEKLMEYQKCDAYWLLVVIDFFDPAQDQEIPSAGFDNIETEKFEKVIVFKTAFEKILEVK
jgi:hypothetical protein